MGQALASAFPEAAQVFERADQALGFSIRGLCFDGPITELTLTKHTQPAIVTASIAALSAIRSAHPSLPAPEFAAGHSLGEYSALVAAGTLSLEDAVRVVNLRGQSMQDAVPEGEGGMAAIMGGDRAAVEALCAEAAQGDVVSPANFNAPGQIVISGHKRAVDRAAALAGSKKLKAIPLKVSAPFHCALMAPAARAVEGALSKLTLQAPRFPVIANVRTPRACSFVRSTGPSSGNKPSCSWQKRASRTRSRSAPARSWPAWSSASTSALASCLWATRTALPKFPSFWGNLTRRAAGPACLRRADRLWSRRETNFPL